MEVGSDVKEGNHHYRAHAYTGNSRETPFKGSTVQWQRQYHAAKAIALEFDKPALQISMDWLDMILKSAVEPLS